MPCYVIRCKFCGEEAEVWRHSHFEVERVLREWECRKCGAKEYEKVPALTSWHFGDALRSKA